MMAVVITSESTTKTRMGNIHETCYDTPTEWTSRDNVIIGASCINTGITATTWDVGDSTGRQVSTDSQMEYREKEN